MKGEKGVCTHRRIVYGVVTVSDKGQIAIPTDLRNDLRIKVGDMLLALKRRDDAGATFVKMDVMDKFMNKIREDEGFFLKTKLRGMKK
ncbi:MAG: hypothetical protein AVW06_02420 [Hadesarchaea archaeon DG-33-1]|nr:MAG: hypothetical protein AVW06_02420 [Hadesarchaea archaeon DG-33-1]